MKQKKHASSFPWKPPTMHTALLLYVLSQHKDPISQIDLTRQVFPFWAVLTGDSPQWLTLSNEQMKARIANNSGLVGNLLKLHDDIIRWTAPTGRYAQRLVYLDHKHRPLVAKFTAQFWKAMQILLSKDEILQVQAEVQRVYPSSAPQIRL